MFFLITAKIPSRVYDCQANTLKLKNIFDDLLDLALAPLVEHDELERYLSTVVEDVKDGLIWWYERCTSFPHLSHMAHNYLSIPGKHVQVYLFYYIIFIDFQATTVDVEHIFSCGQLVLPYVRSHLNVQSTHALMCVGSWSLLGLIDDSDIIKALEW